ncbi:hypothetical protein QBC35DRAFT_499071 [Podospora australis]|uniref:Uncharacterized protein n=1 Tax=Podospora australis TaxID=1536484 RepID=A0AAN6WTQ4_9PEZI|nr:hypothetical protein QBC35DRAFT_499071 [Podospora australis]
MLLCSWGFFLRSTAGSAASGKPISTQCSRPMKMIASSEIHLPSTRQNMNRQPSIAVLFIFLRSPVGALFIYL